MYDRIGMAAGLIYNELHHRGGMDAGAAREVAGVVQSGDQERMGRWFIAGRRTAPGELTVDLFADLDDDDIAELRGSSLFLDVASLLEIRDAMLEQVDRYDRGAALLSNAPE